MRFPAIVLIAVGIVMLYTIRVGEAAEIEASAEEIASVGEQILTEIKGDPWRFVLQPDGSVWGWQGEKRDSLVTWDYGAEVLFEIARGHGHRLWFGAGYRNAAGYRETQSVTPFNPRHIDASQQFAWRWAVKSRREIFIHLYRVCFHEIDLKVRSASFWTHAAMGFGTLSRTEEGEGPMRVREKNRPAIDFYVSAGPFVHGGPMTILGNFPVWQGLSRTYLAGTVPLNRTFLFEASLRWEHLLLSEGQEERESNRLDLRFSLIAQRDRGGFSFVCGRWLHDDFPLSYKDFVLRRRPVAWYFGIAHRF